MTTTIPKSEETRLLEAKIDALTAQVSILVDAQRRQQELLDELMPISREAMSALTHQLADLEERGYFSFGRESLRVLDQVVTQTSPEDLQDLGDNIMTILDTVRSVTRPEILQLAHEASEAIQDTEGDEQIGPWGMFRAASNDKDVRRGLAVVLALLRHVGRGARTIAHNDKLKKIAPRRLPAPRRSAAPTSRRPQAVEVPVATAVPVAAGFTMNGLAFDGEGFLMDPAGWSPDLAASIAARTGIAELTPDHWTLLNFARAEFEAQGKSPNVRRLAKGSGVGVRDLYNLFPDKPAVMVAQIAGVPKPKGCI